MAYSSGWERESFAITENDDDRFFILEEDVVAVPEGDAAGLRVKLGGRPETSLEITLSHTAGETDAGVDSPTLTILATARRRVKMSPQMKTLIRNANVVLPAETLQTSVPTMISAALELMKPKE